MVNDLGLHRFGFCFNFNANIGRWLASPVNKSPRIVILLLPSVIWSLVALQSLTRCRGAILTQACAVVTIMLRFIIVVSEFLVEFEIFFGRRGRLVRFPTVDRLMIDWLALSGVHGWLYRKHLDDQVLMDDSINYAIVLVREEEQKILNLY